MVVTTTEETGTIQYYVEEIGVRALGVACALFTVGVILLALWVILLCLSTH